MKSTLFTPKLMHHYTHLFGTINGKAFDLKGQGYGYPYEGLLTTTLSSTMGAVHFPMDILNPIAVKGYPTFSYYHNGATDLFKISNGYSYTRELNFDDGGYMKTSHVITREDNKLKGEFEVVEGNGINAPLNINGIQQLVETFYPAGPGIINSTFRVQWNTADNKIYGANVKSVYKLNHEETLPNPHFRFVRFDTKSNDTVLKQHEVLMVFNDVKEIATSLINQDFNDHYHIMKNDLVLEIDTLHSEL